MYIDVSFEGNREKILFEEKREVNVLLEFLSKEYSIPLNRLAVFVDSKEITSKTSLDFVDLQHRKIILVKKSFFYVHCNGVCISTVFSLAYKPSVFLDCYVPIFKKRGITIHPKTTKIFFKKRILEENKLLSSYGITDGDTLVLVDSHVDQEKDIPEMWKTTIQALQDRIQTLEKEIDEKNKCISVLTNQLTHSRYNVCSTNTLHLEDTFNSFKDVLN